MFNRKTVATGALLAGSFFTNNLANAQKADTALTDKNMPSTESVRGFVDESQSFKYFSVLQNVIGNEAKRTEVAAIAISVGIGLLAASQGFSKKVK